MAEEKKRSVQIGPGRMKQAQYMRQEWVANAPQGCEIDDLKKPEFWSLMAYQMKPYDRVEVRSDDGTWIVEAIVTACDRTWAKVHILAHHKLTSADSSMDDMNGFSVKWKGPQKKWCIIRESDGAFIREELEDKDKAFEAMKDVQRNVA